MEKEELIDLLDEITSAIGEILAAHAELAEASFGTAAATTQKKIAFLKSRVENEKLKLVKLKAAEARKKELKNINK